MKIHRKLWLLTAVALVGGTAAASAAIPGEDGVIGSCHATLGDHVRPIDAEGGERCRGSEKLLTSHRQGATPAARTAPLWPWP